MNYIAVSNLDGDSILNDNDVPFIVLHLERPEILLEEIDSSVCNRKDSIWKFRKKSIMYALNKFGLSPNKFGPLGHIWFPTPYVINGSIFVLVNTSKKISTFPKDYIKLDRYGEGYIWKPVAPAGYEALGYVYSIHKPSNGFVRVVHKSFIKKYNHKMYNFVKNTNMNEFNYLGQVDSPKYTLIRNNNDTESLDAYKINGELTSYNKKTKKRHAEAYDWDIESDTRSISTDLESTDSWITQKGKYVVLVQPDEPWYVTKEKERTNSPIQVDMNEEDIEYMGTRNDFKENAEFHSNFERDDSKLHLGYGHSYKSRLHGKNCECVKCKHKMPSVYEMFTSENTSTNTKTCDNDKNINICIVFILFVLMVFISYRFYNNLNKN